MLLSPYLLRWMSVSMSGCASHSLRRVFVGKVRAGAVNRMVVHREPCAVRCADVLSLSRAFPVRETIAVGSGRPQTLLFVSGGSGSPCPARTSCHLRRPRALPARPTLGRRWSVQLSAAAGQPNSRSRPAQLSVAAGQSSSVAKLRAWISMSSVRSCAERRSTCLPSAFTSTTVTCLISERE